MLSMSLAACKPLCRLAKFPTAVSRPNREVSIFQAKQGLVPRSHHGRFIVVPTLAGPFRHSKAKEPLNPSILPGYFGKRQATSQTGGELLRFLHQVGAFRVEIAAPSLNVRQASLSDTFTVFKRAKILNVQLHREKNRSLLLI